MESPTIKAVGPMRIVALVLISLTALGLAYVHLSGGAHAVSVLQGHGSAN